MSRFMMRVVLLLSILAWCGVTGFSVSAQDTPTLYTVTAPQTINARGCPRTSCPVLRTFAPGDQLAVIEVTSGETVLDSDQWLHVNVDGVDLFVHSSLAAPVPLSGRDASDYSAPSESSSALTHDWITHTGVGYAVDAPPTWFDATDIVLDEDNMAAAAEALGKDSEEDLQAVTEICGEGGCDLVLADYGGKGGFFLMHVDIEAGMPHSVQFWKLALEEAFKDEGAEIISSEFTELPAGEAVRIHMMLKLVDEPLELNYIVYLVMTGDRMYMLMFYLDSCCVEDSTAIVDGVAASFRYETETTLE
jgi:hypothetical protein